MNENIAKTTIGGTILAQKDGLAESSENGQDWLVAFNTDTTLGWTVVAVASMDELMAPVRRTAFLNFFMTIIILVLAVGVIMYVAARVSRPINTITSSLYMVPGRSQAPRPRLPAQPAACPGSSFSGIFD